MNHPIENPKFNKLDYIRNGIFAAARIQFTLLLEEGASLQQLGIIVSQTQAAIARAYQHAVQDAAGELAGPMPEPPTWNEFPETTPTESTESGEPNPFEDS